MKRRIAGIAALAVATAATLGVPAAAVSARPGDAKGPLCSDIFVTVSFANATGTPDQPATVQWTLTTQQAPSCSGAVYTVRVFDSTGTTLLGGGQYTGDGATDAFSDFFTIAEAPSSVCVSATSEVRGRVTDSAPDSGCQTVPLTTSGGASGMG
jgi:hypothetical protein